ncbi:WD40 repeat-like protein [Lentithecium fluviatile CBS 122367]|uniref:WD40 repeat-like protein n=1 Tax=Lentithecium fluviatile CBS 122367 TaxID=1168545 RepID=A0A6G1J958_9PLEO|nr:WD40 repeat-like protein [Lentithecium fluviatile CBS 122367]
MADVNGMPKLKRKREGAEPLRKKVKTQRKSKTEDAEGETSTPLKAPVSTPSSSNADMKPAPPSSLKKEPTPTPQRSQANSASAADSSTPKARKDKKRDRNQKKDEPKASEAKEPFVERETPTTVVVNGDNADKSTKKEKKQKKRKGKQNDQWSLSEPQGGWFLQQDPVFSPDEKHLLLAKLKTLEVYATETSLLAKELPVGGSGVILSYATSSAQSNQAYIADSAGMITLWDWTNGSKIGRWDIGANVRHLDVVKQPGSDQDLLYTHETGNSHVINVHALRTGAQASKTELRRILKTSKPISGLQVLLGGKIVVASSANCVMVGKRAKLHKTAVQDFEYVWREFETSGRITTFSAYIHIPGAEKSKKPLQDPRDNLDLAIGDSEGVIHLFEDIFTSFAAIEKSQKEKAGKAIGLESLRPKRLHWHREAVGSLKWSRDGNYLISGGDETVLTIWQLSTGKQQHLPHLTAAIENVVVSPSGASYAISLANNSVIVLSTSELLAKTNIIGLQSRRVDQEQQPRESNSSTYSFELFGPVPMTVDSKNSHVIFATPSSQPHRHHGGLLPEPYAQTYDIATHRAVARQALTRNNATDTNVDPEGQRVREPNVQFIQTSHDGMWLATVDEWLPPSSAMGHIEEGDLKANEEERLFRRESYLKIWRWDEKGAQWVLDARIDAPHFHKGVAAHARVVDLVADPSCTGFATVGDDRIVRVWRPKTRTRDGIVVRGGDRMQGLVTWSLDRSIGIPSKLDIDESDQTLQDLSTLQSCHLAFSADGSALAAGVSWASGTDPGVIHIIDADEGIIRRSITEIDITELSGLGIFGRYLIAVSNTIVVWDMVIDQFVHSMPIDTPGVDTAHRAQLVRLAVNEEDGTFAVSAPRFEKEEKAGSRRFLKTSTRVSVFDPNHPKALWNRSVPGIVLALASAKGGRGYITLDASSSIRTISPKATTQQLPTPPPETMPLLLTDSVDVDEIDDAKQKPYLQLDASEELLRDSENDKPVVRPEQLQAIFESGSSNALPAVRDLFDAIVGLYARKPRASGVVGAV